MVDGAYGRYAAELTEEDMPVDSEEYLSDDSTDSELFYDYRNRFTPPTPPHLRLESGETAYRVISDDDDLDLSSYFLDADPDDDWVQFDGIKDIGEDIGYNSEDIYMSDDYSPMSDSANLVDISGEAGDSSIFDTDSGDKSVTTPKIRRKKKVIIPPTLCKGYYGRKRFRRGHRHYISSVIE